MEQLAVRTSSEDPPESEAAVARRQVPASRRFLALSLLILFLATGLRIYRLGSRSLWLDEVVAANDSHGSIQQMLALTRSENSAPIIHPALLYAIERFDNRPSVLRLPSVIASILALIVVLAMARYVGAPAAGLAALLLAISASQVRYAQEVREYSLGILYAAVLLYAFLSYAPPEGAAPKPVARKAFFALLFAAPLLQYGLALFATAILVSLIVLLRLGRLKELGVFQIAAGIACLGAGSLISFLLTLHYQMTRTLTGGYYLTWDYAHGLRAVPKFVVHQTIDLLAYTLPVPLGRVGLFCGIAALGAVVVILWRRREVVAIVRRSVPLLLVTAASLAILAACASIGAYPYGGIRQCLFVAPAVALVVGTALSGLIGMLGVRWKGLLVAAVAAGIVLCGAARIRGSSPYLEGEDIQSVLKALAKSIQSGDRVYIYYGAVPATSYYWKDQAPPAQFFFSPARQPHGIASWTREQALYGGWHRNDPGGFIPEILSPVHPGTSRLWLVFSHGYGEEEQSIVERLRQSWDIKRMVRARGAALYLAQRRG
jgi:hypothetical protein